jgi:hypothetical protein
MFNDIAKASFDEDSGYINIPDDLHNLLSFV